MEKYFLLGFLKATGEEHFIDALAEYFKSTNTAHRAFTFITDLNKEFSFPAKSVYHNVTYTAASYDAFTRELIANGVSDTGRQIQMKFTIEDWIESAIVDNEIVTCVVTRRVNIFKAKGNAQEMKNEAVSNNSSNIYTEDLFQA